MIDHVSDIILAHAAGAARTPVEAISVLDALPTHRAPSVLTAVLSRGFNEYQPSMAVKHGLGLALLPHYPRYILFDDIEDTLVISGACGDLLTIELLWQMAGPTTPCRPAWHAKYGILANAVEHGHLTVLEWVTRATRTAGVTEIDWLRFLWPMAATKGHAHILTWAIAQGHLTELSPYHVLLSTREGDPCIMDWWIASQPSKEAAMTELSNTRLIQNVTSMGALKTLDWWWENAGSKLPRPELIAANAHTALTQPSLKVIEWWWTHFLEHCTPNHTFCGQLEIGLFQSVQILDWYWQHYSKECSLSTPGQNDGIAARGLIFRINGQSNMPILKWAMEKCAELGGQKLKLTSGFFNSCAIHAQVGLLDFVLHSANVLEIDMGDQMVVNAVQYGNVSVLEWWDCNRDKLPPQLFHCREQLLEAVQHDAADLLVWWHAHMEVSSSLWQRACVSAIEHNSRRVQLWLLDNPDLVASELHEAHLWFVDRCISALNTALPFTLNFFMAFFWDLDLALPKESFGSITTVYWFCAHTNVTVASLLPLNPKKMAMLLQRSQLTMMEWWLHVHIAAGCPFLLPPAAELARIFQQHDKLPHWWVHDAVVTRKIAVFVKSDSGDVVPYQPEVPLFLQ